VGVNVQPGIFAITFPDSKDHTEISWYLYDRTYPGTDDRFVVDHGRVSVRFDITDVPEDKARQVLAEIFVRAALDCDPSALHIMRAVKTQLMQSPTSVM